MATRYQVSTTEYARDRLADLWTQAPQGDRAAITKASNAIDRELVFDAEQKGDPINPNSPDLRIYEVHPLRVSCGVSPDDLRVNIIEYELITPKP